MAVASGCEVPMLNLHTSLAGSAPAGGGPWAYVAVEHMGPMVTHLTAAVGYHLAPNDGAHMSGAR